MTNTHLLSAARPRPAFRLVALAALALGLLLLAGCAYTGDLAEQPRYNPLSASSLFPNGQSALPLQPGTVPYSPGQSPNSPALTGLDASGQPVKNFPVPVDKALVQKGQERYNIYCIPCHGPEGKGDGKVVAFNFPKPADLLSDPIKNLSDGDIFQVITNGKGKMFPYGYRVKPDERWAVIAYVRALQQKNGKVDPQSLTPDDLNQIGK